jgi:hypothetical protein
MSIPEQDRPNRHMWFTKNRPIYDPTIRGFIRYASFSGHFLHSVVELDRIQGRKCATLRGTDSGRSLRIALVTVKLRSVNTRRSSP